MLTLQQSEPHRITSALFSTARGEVQTCRFGSLAVTHHTDALSRLCRKMVAQGFTGSAVVVAERDGRPSLHVRSIEALATRTLTETTKGFRWAAYRPHPAWCAGVSKNGASASDAPFTHVEGREPIPHTPAHRKAGWAAGMAAA